MQKIHKKKASLLSYKSYNFIILKNKGKDLAKIIYLILFSLWANAHFLTVIPSNDYISNTKNSKISFETMFIHPFEQSGMIMEEPLGFFVKNEKLPLTQIKKFDHKAWQTEYKIKKPGVYQFYVKPQPYFEASEEKYISHVPKVIISAFGLENDWDKALGLKYEIVPITKPFGLYSGNLFQGKVLHNGKAASNIEVEIELYNTFELKAPTPAHITQVIKTDENGIFSFVMNHKGWWGFAALIEEGEKEFKGKMYPIENGALLWIKAY